MNIRTLVLKDEILPVLEHDRLYAAYAIGDLAEGLFEQCTWVVAENSMGACALAMTFGGLYPPALFVMGSTEGVAAILDQRLRPHQAYLTMRPEHVATVSRYYGLAETRRMWRMSVSRETFRPVSAPVIRLGVQDINDLNALYAWGGGNFFSAYQLQQGVYYAAQVQGNLVAAAGTHVVTPEQGIGIVGNVYTHPDFRNQGWATACTSAVVAELLRIGCRSIVLNVRQDNAPAIRAYEKLGFSVYCPFIESTAQAKSSLERFIDKALRRIEHESEARR